MGRNNCKRKINVGNTFNGPTKLMGQVIINFTPQEHSEEKATCMSEPLWRSPFTLGVLTWISVIIGILY